MSVRSGDPDEAREVGTRVYHRHRVTVLGDAAHFAMSLDAASLGPLTVGWLSYDTEVRIESSHQGHYQVNVPQGGSVIAVSGGREVVAGPGAALVHVPDRDAVFTGWASPGPVLALRIARTALDRELEQLLDRPLRHSIELDLHLDLSSGRGAQWSALVRSLATDLADENALIRQPMLAGPFTHSVMTGLLLTALHEHRDELGAPTPAAGASVVRRARDHIEAHAGDPLTVGDIARAVGVGVRGLQQGFQRSLGTSPTEYVRHVRLRHVHRDLLAADPAMVTVGQVAARWGFPHHGRFAAHYRERYGVLPGESLRRRP
ncbi:AraC family transcriptional regulator [Geodermatophilus sabuli]|uniref:AraC family transcriptional regulator n=1 Tax=Geodermatophilus sabuli TaxID=1564158 RepID=A0A7K3W3M8_9ACTN|nr:AraC family transcriptional regulator [Geodermatophilus sabuli]